MVVCFVDIIGEIVDHLYLNFIFIWCIHAESFAFYKFYHGRFNKKKIFYFRQYTIHFLIEIKSQLPKLF